MASKIRKEQAYTFIETFKLLIDENDKLKAENEALKLDYCSSAPKDHPSLKTFIEKSPLVKQVKDLRTEIKELKELIEYLSERKEYWKEKFTKERDDNRKLSLIELKEIHYQQMKEENKTLKEALNRIRRDLSPDR